MLEHIGPIVERVMAKLERPDELDDTLVRLLAEHESAVRERCSPRAVFSPREWDIATRAEQRTRAALLRHIGLLSQPQADSFPEAVT